MTFACSGGAALDAGGGKARHARGGCFILRLRLWNCAQQSGPLLAAALSIRNAVSALSARQSPSCRTTSSLPHTFKSVCFHSVATTAQSCALPVKWKVSVSAFYSLTAADLQQVSLNERLNHAQWSEVRDGCQCVCVCADFRAPAGAFPEPRVHTVTHGR